MTVLVADQQDRPVDADRLRRLAAHVLSRLDVPVDMELSVRCVHTEEIARLNERHLHETGPTDVLAFPIDRPGEAPPGTPALLGDVVVCPRVAAHQAHARGQSAASELDLLVVHGILHLLGHDHAEPGERVAMFALTDRLLASFE